MKTLSVCVLVSLCGASACIQADDDENVDVGIGDDKADAVRHVTVTDGSTSTVSFKATGGALDVSIDCTPPANPDIVGTQFTIKSAALGAATATPVLAGFWERSGDVPAGTQKIEISGTSGSQSCAVRVKKVTSQCSAASAFRSSETGHTHLFVGTTPASGSFPASGNHWGAWAKWNTVYSKPVKRGFYLHNLEHGGIVLSYKCASATASAECEEAAANMEALKDSFGEIRVIVTPDPQQDSLYGIRAWRTGFQSECFDETRMLAFMDKHFRHGREDVDADPPVAYDPTTSQVPCVDLMAAPDSCN